MCSTCYKFLSVLSWRCPLKFQLDGGSHSGLTAIQTGCPREGREEAFRTWAATGDVKMRVWMGAGAWPRQIPRVFPTPHPGDEFTAELVFWGEEEKT